MSDQTIPTDPTPNQMAAMASDVPSELLRPIEDRIADSVAAKAARMAEMRARR